MISAFMLVIAGTVVLRLPELGEIITEWMRTFSLLRGFDAAPRLGIGRAALRSEIDHFIQGVHGLERMTSRERDELAAQTLIARVAHEST